MIDWAARAKAELGLRLGQGTDESDENRVSSVSSVSKGALVPTQAAISSVSSVLSVAPSDVSANDEVGPSPSPALIPRSGNPYMTPEQGNECHEGCWNDIEIETFMARSARFRAMGRIDAEHLAERLTLRDRQADDRRLCVECRELEASGRCAAARRGVLANTDRRLEPTQNTLMRCPAFRGGNFQHR